MKATFFSSIQFTILSLFAAFAILQSCTKEPVGVDSLNQGMVTIKNGIVHVSSVEDLQGKVKSFTKDDWTKLDEQYQQAGFQSLMQAWKSTTEPGTSSNDLIAGFDNFAFQHYAPFLTTDGVIAIGDVLVRFFPDRVVSCKGDDLNYLMSIDDKSFNLGASSNYLVAPIVSGPTEAAAERSPYDFTVTLGECSKTNINFPPYYLEGTFKEETKLLKHLWAIVSYENGTQWNYELVGKISAYRYNYLTFQYDPYPYPIMTDLGDYLVVEGNFVRTSEIMGNNSGSFYKFVHYPSNYIFSTIIDSASGRIKGDKPPAVDVTGKIKGTWTLTPYPNPGFTFLISCDFIF